MDYINQAMPGLNGDGDDLFDFEAASAGTSWADTHNVLATQAQTVRTDECTQVMPLTKTEVEAVLAARASNAQNSHRSCGLTRAELDTNFSEFKESCASGAYSDYDGAEIPVSTNFGDFNMLECCNPPSNTSTSSGSKIIEPYQLDKSADELGAFTPNVANQLVLPTPTNRPMTQPIDSNVSSWVASSLIQTEEATQQRENLESVRRLWSVGGKCVWPGCTSKAVFKTKGSFNMHWTNVHTKPLVCLTPNCPVKTPFGRLSDLRRHEQSVHSAERRFVCEVSSCDAYIKEFARKDHLVNHMRERHDNYFCPFNHCPHSTASDIFKPEDMAEHIKLLHGVYEMWFEGLCASAAVKVPAL